MPPNETTKATMTLTIEGVRVTYPMPLDSVIVDMVVCVDFRVLAEQLAYAASRNQNKQATCMNGAVIAKATNLRSARK